MVGRKSAPAESIDLYRPVSLSGKVLKLHYAREEELGPYLGATAIEGEVYVQFWLKRAMHDRVWLGSPAAQRARLADLAGW